MPSKAASERRRSAFSAPAAALAVTVPAWPRPTHEQAKVIPAKAQDWVELALAAESALSHALIEVETRV